ILGPAPAASNNRNQGKCLGTKPGALHTGTTHIGKFVINHSFLVPGAISVFTSCVVGSLLAQVLL
ncbi:hypothetical protein, partial [Corynebacterium marquesiae]|uniref:hypothetical protein n=1 Tax=Corynebacterium marquesiae TaxID=2913503 RepID=UPI00307FEFF4